MEQAERLNPTDTISIRTPSGREVILSQEALTTYGQTYIESLADRAKQDRLLLADEHVLADAQARFPNSNTPLLDNYSEFLVDAENLLPKIRKIYPDTKIEVSVTNEDMEHRYEAAIKEHETTAFSDVDRNNGMITLPSKEALQSDSYKLSIASQLSGLREPLISKDIPGTSLEWAKKMLDHEAGHLKLGHRAERLKEDVEKIGNSDSSPRAIDFNSIRNYIYQEVEADLSTVEPFNQASGIPSIMRSLQNFRSIESSTSGTTLDTMASISGGNYSASALDKANKSNQPLPIEPDRIQYATAYRNSLVETLINSAHKSHSEQLAEITPSEDVNNDARKMNIYAANVALLKSGQLDYAPEAKYDAQLFVTAVQESAPGLISEKRHQIFNEVIAQPEVQAELEKVKLGYDANPKLEKFVQSLPSQAP